VKLKIMVMIRRWRWLQMINELNEQLTKLNEQLFIIQNQKKECKKCKEGKINTGNKIIDHIKTLSNKWDIRDGYKGTEIYTDEIIDCDCIKINGKRENQIEYEVKEIMMKINQVKYSMPEEYINIDLKNINSKILNFDKSNNIFMWIYGKVGTGKTYSINGLRLKYIINNHDFKILKEYDLDYKDIDNYKSQFFCIDDFGISENENRNISLLDLYFELIDHKREKHSKLIITSNLSIIEWLNKMKKYNYETALRISSRFSNKIEIIELTGEDRRKIIF
jgi:DNA replication protein DnaC